MTEWLTNIREAGLFLPEAISLRVPTVPLGFARQLCKKQRVMLGDSPGDTGCTVQDQDRIVVKPSARWRELLALSPLPPAAVLYEDEACLVVDKPSGLAVHKAQGHDDNLTSRVRDYLAQRRETFRVAPVHRLDAGTSGAILFGKGKKAVGQLGRLLMAGEMSKRYLAVVRGVVSEAGRLTSPVAAKGRMKPALTRLRPIADNGRTSLIELELVTGRRHQIRQQLSAAGWPIVGDDRYRQGSKPAGGRLLLHCYALAFPDPVSGRRVAISCLPPKDFVAALESSGPDTRDLSGHIPKIVPRG